MPQVTHVSSLADPRLDVFRDVRDKDLRGRPKLFMAESEMVLRRLLRTPERLHSLLLSQQRYEQLQQALAALPQSVPVFIADVELMTRIAGFHIHRGVLTAGMRPQASEVTLDAALGHLRDRPQLTLLGAEGLTNVDNMGGLFRNAAAFEADGIVLDPTCCDPLYRKAIRVSMGHVLAIPWAVSESWSEDLIRLKHDWGCFIVAAEPGPAADPLWKLPRPARMLILFGSEGAGLSEQTLSLCDALCEIPMALSCESINVATASAVFLYERQRGDR